MSEFLSPDTNIAVMTAAQGQTDKIGNAIKSANKLDNAAIEEAAQEFEAVFLAEMMKPMFEGTEAPAPFNGGKGEEIFQGFMLQEYGKIVAQTGSIGIADTVRSELINIQEKSQ